MNNTQLPDANQLLELIETVLDATVQMHMACANGNNELFESLSEDIDLAFKSFMPMIRDYSRVRTLYLACESIVDSLNRIVAQHKADPIKCAHKIEFELLPRIQTFYENFYFYEIVSFDEELLKLYPERDGFLPDANSLCAVVSVIPQSELHSMNYDVDLSTITREKIRFLLRRLEFGIEPDKARLALSAALSTGRISKEDFNSIIAM